MKIVRLPESWAARIAAGEVVERPASVVKELVENSLDAGAREISVWIEASGISLIRISDDGEGISAEDLPLAVERHATSKLKDEQALWRIGTLGFRGEALPSIGSVSKLAIVSRARDASAGHRLAVEGGARGDPAPAGCGVGTTIEVRDLFYNTPARRKFLKAPATELSRVCDVVNHMALAYPEVHFRLYHEGQILCDYPSGAPGQERLEQVFGKEIASGMASFCRVKGRVKLGGFLSKAPGSFSTSRYLFTYVNRRFVRDRILNHAILQGYETLLMKGRYPAAVLYIEIPYEDVDVNVHPAKHEVRFRRQAEVHDAVAEGVREALRQEAKTPSQPFAAPRAEPAGEVREAGAPYGFDFFGGDIRSLPVGGARPLEDATRLDRGFFSSLEIIGQALGCYLICAAPHGLILIDQHAAHERVAFEKMRQQLAGGGMERQELLVPQVLELPAGEAGLLEQCLELLDRFGFGVEKFGRSGYTLRTVPALLPAGDYREALRRMIAEVAEVGQSEELSEELEDRLATIACHSVIRANRKLEKEEIRALLDDLDRCDFATQCPHGRPVLIELTEGQLERMFKRT